MFQYICCMSVSDIGKKYHNMIVQDLRLIDYDISGLITLQRVISFSPITKKYDLRHANRTNKRG